MKTLYLHIGLQKTGTTSVQMHLMCPGGGLEAAGIDYLPTAIAPAHAHHNAAWDIAGHKRYRPGLPGIDALVTDAHATQATRLFVSSEDFSILPPARVASLAERLSGFTVRPILCLRNPLDWTESLYAQACKRGNPGSFATYMQRLHDGGRLDFDRILDCWSTTFGAAAMTVLIYEDHADIADAVARLLDLPPAPKALRRNKSLNERFVLASQQIVTDCKAGILTVAGRPVPPALAPLVSRTLLATGVRTRAFAGSPVFLDRAAAQDFLDRYRPMTDRIAAHVALPASYRQVDPARRTSRPPEKADTDILMAALQTSLGMETESN